MIRNHSGFHRLSAVEKLHLSTPPGIMHTFEPMRLQLSEMIAIKSAFQVVSRHTVCYPLTYI